MEKLNMAKMNTLIKKGYLLAGVIMAANMFAVNEMKASAKLQNKNKGKTYVVDDNDLTFQPTYTSNTNSNGNIIPNQYSHEKKLNIPSIKKSTSKKGKNSVIKKNTGKKGGNPGEQSFFGFLLSYENTINLIGGLVLSGANNYFKWWDYNAGGYLNLRIGCLGWRSKRLLDIFQFEVNLNGIRGALWLIPGAYNFIKSITKDNGKDYAKPLHVSFLVYNLFDDETSVWPLIAFIGVFLLQGFVSMPLTLHFSKFSISISLDSMIWAVIGHILGKNDRGMKNSDPNNIIKFHNEPLKKSFINNGGKPNDNLYQPQPKEENQKGKKSLKKNESKKPDLIIEGEKDNENEMNQNKKDPTKDETKEEEKKEETEKNQKNVPENLE